MIHSFLLDKPFLDTISHTLIDEIKNINADIILSGHYHSGFKTLKYKEKYFINPGSLLRTSSSKLELKRTPKVIILEISKEETIINEIYLKTALPGDKVLKINNDFEKARIEALEEFKQLVRSNTDLNNYNIYEILKEISTKKNFPKKILEMALSRLEDVEVKK